MAGLSSYRNLTALAESLRCLPESELAELDSLLSVELWVPQPGPQSLAFHSQADILFYGGAAGGGKTDLGIGLALSQHTRSIFFRREATQLLGVYDRIAEILGGRDGFSGHDKVWRVDGRTIEFGSAPNLGDETRYQGRPHSLKVFDEVPNFLESQFRFLCGWLRTTIKGERKRIVALGNPPTDSDGEWVVRFWAPWLDENHPNPAKPGQLRWFAMVDGKDVERPDAEPFEHRGKMLRPLSRTFIPSLVEDNAFLMETGYDQILDALPEPLRSQMRDGDFRAGRGDNPWQVIPSEWVRAAQARWQPRHSKGPMTAMGVDVARGGSDKSVLAPRHDNWFDELIAIPGVLTPDGPTLAGVVIGKTRNGAQINVDVIGVGGSVFDFLRTSNVNATGVNVAQSSEWRDKSGRLRAVNRRSELYWRMRESLDPANDQGLQLPNDPELLADLCSAHFQVTPRGIKVESKEDIKERIGRSPDKGDAVLLANIPADVRGVEIDMRPDAGRSWMG